MWREKLCDMFERALYYPTIDIKNDRWLKSAVLFWDRIETIVPESINEPYKRKLTRQLADEEILFPHYVNPFCEDVTGIEQDVVKYLQTKEGKRSFIKPWAESVVARHTFADDELRVEEAFMNRICNEYEEFYIHVGKLPPMLQKQLEGHQNESGFVLARKGFMSFYMTLLANRICQNNNMSLLTDKVNQNNLSNKIMIEGLTPKQRRNETDSLKSGLIYEIIMDDIKIDPTTDIEAIIRYKRDRRHELALFRDKMDKLMVFDVEGMGAKDIEHEIWNIYMGQVKPAMDGVKATLKDAGINWRTGLGTCMFTGLIPAVLGFGPDLKTNIAIGASECIGLAITTIPYVRKRMEVNGSPYSYLMKMDKQLNVSWKSENRVV